MQYWKWFLVAYLIGYLMYTLGAIKVENVKFFWIILGITKSNVKETIVFSQINSVRNNHKDSTFSPKIYVSIFSNMVF